MPTRRTPARRRGLDRPRARQRPLVLRDLIALGQVRIEVVLAREDRRLVDPATERERGADREVDRGAIEDRQRARETETDRTDVRVGRSAERRAAAAEDLRGGQEVRVDLQPDDRLVRARHTRGPAARTPAATSPSNVLKFSANICARRGRLPIVVREAGPGVPWFEHLGRHVRAARRHVDVEHRVPFVANRIERTGERRPDHRPRVADLHARARAVRPAGPARVDEPHVRADAARSARRASSRTGSARSGRNGAPKQVLNVAFGSVTPFSVPATFAVYPDRKWYIAPSGVSREIGGSTPKASAVSITTFCGCPPCPEGTALSMNEIG